MAARAAEAPLVPTGAAGDPLIVLLELLWWPLVLLGLLWWLLVLLKLL